jgi:hypothetical protein
MAELSVGKTPFWVVMGGRRAWTICFPYLHCLGCPIAPINYLAQSSAAVCMSIELQDAQSSVWYTTFGNENLRRDRSVYSLFCTLWPQTRWEQNWTSLTRFFLIFWRTGDLHELQGRIRSETLAVPNIFVRYFHDPLIEWHEEEWLKDK